MFMFSAQAQQPPAYHISEACLGQHLACIVNNGQQSAVLHAFVMLFFKQMCRFFPTEILLMPQIILSQQSTSADTLCELSLPLKDFYNSEIEHSEAVVGMRNLKKYSSVWKFGNQRGELLFTRQNFTKVPNQNPSIRLSPPDNPELHSLLRNVNCLGGKLKNGIFYVQTRPKYQLD